MHLICSPILTRLDINDKAILTINANININNINELIFQFKKLQNGNWPIQNAENYNVEKQKDGTYSVRAKKYLYDIEGNIRRGKPISIFNGPFTQDGTKEIREHFGTEDAFKFAKPSELIRKLISLQINGKSNKSAVVLDFFAGSGTTAQAVLEQNKRDKGQRRFILCTNNEGDICSSVTYPRIMDVIDGYNDLYVIVHIGR